MTKKWVYSFSAQRTDGNREMKDLLGGKGANLAEMSALGLSVPPGVTLTTEACLDFAKSDNSLRDDIKKQTLDGIREIEKLTGKNFGDLKNPLLFSVRSGARVSMPGMMDTVLNLGLNDESVQGLATQTTNERFAWDSYRRFIQMYANVVMEMNTSLLEATLEDLKEAREVELDTELTAADLQDLVAVYKNIILEETGHSFPLEPEEQLWMAIAAVFKSWNNPRAIKYREINGISDEWGTAVNIQSMAFGNMGDDSATGVCFTRDPSTGDKRFFGEFLINAQGEDVVAGIRTPAPINEESRISGTTEQVTLEQAMPEAYKELCNVYNKLELHYKDMQDIEFTIEKGTLYILQTRNGKRTAEAALNIAVDLVAEGKISKEEALLRVDPEDLNQLLHPRIDPGAKKEVIAKGLPASPGAASGEIVFNSDEAERLSDEGRKVLLVRQETSPEDINGMATAQGILTARGGMTSHAAVVARGMGRPCVAGCHQVVVDEKNETLLASGQKLAKGDWISIDGATGEVIKGEVKTIPAQISGAFETFMSWAKEAKRLKVRANADNPEDSEMALKFGAEGIGLCRTEHMFFDPERVLAVREMIFAQDSVSRAKALEKLLPYQREDFIGLFNSMNGRPVNIRLLDPPLHEFLPHTEVDFENLAKALGKEVSEVKEKASQLEEFNPMLGHRGCRLGVTAPEIYEMQVRAIIEAALKVKENGVEVRPEIMIPLIAKDSELSFLRGKAQKVIDEILSKTSIDLDYKIGTMIELPRAAITADEVAEHAEFFSFGTNDLTQTTFGLSRDDSGKFLPDYIRLGLFEKDPFVTLDQSGVGFLVKRAAELGRKARPSLHIGICGEHGGDPCSVRFCHAIGLDYVSCSPYRVPIAILASAQAALDKS